jgi:acetyl-CoA carboxylase carboxyltransferase component
MEGESAVKALFPGVTSSPEIDQTRADYERWLDAKYAAARGHCDAVIDPLETREILTLALDVAMQRPRAVPLALETL